MATLTAADIKNVELLAGFQPEELEELASQLKLLDYSEGVVVFTVGDSTGSN